MARKKRAARSSGPTCSCGPGNWLWVIITAIVMGIGVWLLVGGYLVQSAGGTWQNSLTWYALSFLVFGIGKAFKKRSAGTCKVHC
jgi:hypothetical protein